jgi:signal transduction histidine kinase
MKSFELSLQPAEPARPTTPRGLGGPVLLNNAFWFMRFRWIVVAIFVAVGLVGRLLGVSLRQLGLIVPYRGLWILAVVLSAYNVVFYFIARQARIRANYSLVKANIWLQIVSDLLVVTFLVHIVGSTYTFIPFLYLFHITLSCIFFPKKESLVVILTATGFYLTAVALEATGVWPAQGMLVTAPAVFRHVMSVETIFALSAVFFWYVEWYLVSSLSEVVRLRDQQLSVANQQLRDADEEMTRQVLLTTHDLKAPFAGMESNIQVLKSQYWTDLPEPTRAIIERIDQRAQTLRERIRDILILGDLRSRGTKESASVPVDLQRVVQGVVEEVAEKAESRNISLEIRVPALRAVGDPEQTSILISNLLSNAIFYSREGGVVSVLAEAEEAEVCLAVSDHGIGIREEALAHIFDEYYRTKEAARFNKNSTGLGLSIVREIAQNLHLKVTVSSEVGTGTTFEVRFPRYEDGNQEEQKWQKSR